MSFALILAGGVPPESRLLLERAAGATLFVCADSGAEAARREALRPDAVVGDFDSISAATLRHFRSEGSHILEDRNPDTTDLDKSIRYVLARGPVPEIVVLGATAGRFDHVLGHLGLMHRHFGATRLVLEDAAVRAWLGGPDIVLDSPVGTTVSFFAVGEPVDGVTTEGLRYPLTGARLEMGGQDSVSNVVEVRPARIRLKGGRLLVVEVKEEGPALR